jgi:hypothetical protein
MGTDKTDDWAVTHLSSGGADLCNMYVACAAAGGLASMILFILLLVKCFSNLGLALKTSREMMPEAEGLLWCLGCCLFAHVVTFFSVTYWDQMFVPWWALLAVICSVTLEMLKSERTVEELEDITGESFSEAGTLSPCVNCTITATLENQN